MSNVPLLVIDIGGTHLKFGSVVGPEHKVLGRHFSTDLLRCADPIGALAKIIVEASDALEIKPAKIVSSIPGFLAPDHDLVHYAGNIQSLNGRRVASELSARTGLPVLLERDSVMMLQGEWLAGAAQGAQNVLGLFFGTGVGAAFLKGGIPFRGAGFALEVGSMPFRRDGRRLPGRRTDCLETYVSGAVLQEMASRHGVSISDIFISASSELHSEVEPFFRDLTIAVGMATAMFSPDCILLGGGICDMAGFPKERIAAEVAANAPIEEMGMKMDLRWAHLGWEAVLRGAARVAESGFGGL